MDIKHNYPQTRCCEAQTLYLAHICFLPSPCPSRFCSFIEWVGNGVGLEGMTCACGSAWQALPCLGNYKGRSPPTHSQLTFSLFCPCLCEVGSWPSMGVETGCPTDILVVINIARFLEELPSPLLCHHALCLQLANVPNSSCSLVVIG